MWVEGDKFTNILTFFNPSMADELDDQLDYEIQSSESETEQKVEEDNKSQNESSIEDKKARKKAKDKERKRVKNEMDFDQKKTLAQMDPSMIADYITKKVLATEPELSGLELAEKTIPEAQVVSTNSFDEDHSLANYGEFFEKFGLNKKGKNRDLVLVLTMSAIRVCDVVRALRKVNKGGALKLIKQNKPDYDKRCLKSPAHVACSTPGRVQRLVDWKILDLKRVTKVVVDSSFVDVKQRTVWEIDGTVELVAKLAHQNNAQIYLY